MNVLSFVARPFYMESPTSILIRTAKFNGYRDVWDMCLALGVSLAPWTPDIRLLDQPLCNILCSEAPCLANDIKLAFFEHPARQLLRGSHIKVNNHDVSTRSLTCRFFSCPVCLKLGYSRIPQDFTLFDFCPAHNVRLTSACPNCGHINQWKKICGFTCECGFNLADAEVIPYHHRLSIDLPSVFGVQDASQLINNYQRAEAQKIKLAEPWLIEDPSAKEFYAQIKKAIQVDLDNYRQLPVSVFESVWATVKDPALRQFAIDYLKLNHKASGQCEKEHCCAAIKLSLRQLGHALNAGAFATRDFINEMSMTAGLIPVTNTICYSHPSLCAVIQVGLKPSRQHNIVQQKEYCSAATAAVLLQTTTTSVRAAVQRGFFPNLVWGDRACFISNTSVQAFKTRFAFYSEIADSLGIPRKTLTNHASRLGLIEAYDRQPTEPAIYLRSSVNLNRMRKKLITIRIKKSRCSPAIKELRTLAAQFDLTMTVLYHILKVYCGCNTPTKALLPSQRLALEQWLAAHITLKAASGLLNTSLHTLNARFIRSSLVPKIDICKVRFIDVENLPFMAAHLKKYMSRIEASKFLCVAESVVLKLVQEGKLRHILLKTAAGPAQILIEN